MIQNAKLDKKTPVPLYFQLKTIILDEIKKGEYKSGAPIPTENELSEIFDISRTTIRQAITELVREGYLYRVKSKGTFVSKPKLALHVSEAVHTIGSDAENEGYETHIEVLDCEIVPMPQVLIDLGAGNTTDKAVYLYRKRYLDDTVLGRSITYLPYEKFPDIMHKDLGEGTLRKIMDSNPDTTVARWERTLEAVTPDTEDCHMLDIKDSSPILKITTIRYNNQNEVLDVSYVFNRGDMAKIEININND